MLKYVMFFDTIGLSMAALAIFILRKKTKDMDTTDIYTIKWFPLVPLIFIISYWFVTINIFITFRENPYAALICLAAYALGLVIYYACTYNKNRNYHPNKMDLSYILNELGEERENYFNAVSPPIIQTSNFTFKTVKDFGRRWRRV